MAAILHDVGKVTVPDHVLRKREPLTEREWEAIKRSPVRGAEMVARIQGLEEIVPWIRHSHERFDGSGYPSGLTGEKIPPACRVIHVADAFDAMVSGRPYRAAVSTEEALVELRLHAGTQFDPECVERLEEYFEFRDGIGACRKRNGRPCGRPFRLSLGVRPVTGRSRSCRARPWPAERPAGLMTVAPFWSFDVSVATPVVELATAVA